MKPHAQKREEAPKQPERGEREGGSPEGRAQKSVEELGGEDADAGYDRTRTPEEADTEISPDQEEIDEG